MRIFFKSNTFTINIIIELNFSKELGINFTEEEIGLLLNDLDSDGDGEINYR
jgi:Ca2+-binding EF-hand superfamily protein